VQVLPWHGGSAAASPGNAVIEAFGCELDPAFVAAMTATTRRTGRQPAWINLEYLSAEAFVERCHGLPSPVSSGPGQGLVKHFFYPGFTPGTGGLLREPHLAARQARFNRSAWLQALGIPDSSERLASLFCYEPAALGALLAQIARSAGTPRPTRLLVTAGRATAAVNALLRPGSRALRDSDTPPALTFLPLLAQEDFDHLLWACDVNFVRGEDSLVRALWAGKPLVWQAYPQDDGVHHAKLEAFLDWQQAPPATRHWHTAWNGATGATLPLLDELWSQEPVAALRSALGRLQAQPDLVTQLLDFVRSR